MSEFKGTPGPWEAVSNERYWEIREETGQIADLGASQFWFDGGDMNGPVTTANAQLIAASPELLEACLRARNQFYAAGYEPKAGSMNPTECLLAQLIAAISKATGE